MRLKRIEGGGAYGHGLVQKTGKNAAGQKTYKVYFPKGQAHRQQVEHHFNKSIAHHTLSAGIPPYAPIGLGVSAYHTHKAKDIIRRDHRLK